MVFLKNDSNRMILLVLLFGHMCTTRCSRFYYEGFSTPTSGTQDSTTGTADTTPEKDSVHEFLKGEAPSFINRQEAISKRGEQPTPPAVYLMTERHHPERRPPLAGRRFHRYYRRLMQRYHPHQRRYHRHIPQMDNMVDFPKLEFSPSEYSVTVKENLPLQSSILQVKLTSPVAFPASDVYFSVDDVDNFRINRSGVVYNTRPLDFERSNGMHRVIISVHYKGNAISPSPSDDRVLAKALAIIRIEDVQEPPRFLSDHYFFNVPEVALSGDYVGEVKALDDDNDLDSYRLQKVDPQGMFIIDAKTGIIRLGRLPPSHKKKSTYDFYVSAKDFGGRVIMVPVTVNFIDSQPTYARLVWDTKDESNHKPNFHDCSAYDRIHVKENMTEGTPVLMVIAKDDDPGDNGKVSYFLLDDFKSFKIESSNQQGQITTTKLLDREGEDQEFLLTVVARDRAPISLQDSCSFRVIVEDVNDNPPIFDEELYEETISTDHQPGTPVLRVTASDYDYGPNAQVTYHLQGMPEDLDYFTIDAPTGIVSLAQPLDKEMANERVFEMRARADDGGTPMLWSTTNVKIRVVSSDDLPPSIISQQPLFPAIFENTTENTDVLSICAKSNLADSSLVYFTLLNGNTPHTNSEGTFAIRRMEYSDLCQDSQGAIIFVATKNLDFETVEEYKLTVQIVNERSSQMEKKIKVSIIDVNDNAPLLQQFHGSVLENVDRTLVTTIRAQDKDTSPQFRQLRFSFDPMASGEVRKKFALKTNGELWTTEPLDREEFKQYKIPIKVSDGVPAHQRMTIYWIKVQDLNDVAPVFDRDLGVYEVQLPENREVGMPTGINLVVNDSDSVNQFTYEIVEGNAEKKFRIDAATGEILVNKVLDFDHPVFDRNFTLRVSVNDGANPSVETDVVIAVMNVNDLQPVFERSNYSFTVTENTDCNITFGKISALDPDLPPTVNQKILYYLSPSELHNFTIDSKTGDLSIRGCLDREAGASKGTVILYPRANDEGGRGHDAEPATVHIIIRDLNDNHPHIHTPENSYARIQENVEPDDVKPIIIKLDDEDGPENGCPCTMEFDPSTPSVWLRKFTLFRIEGLSSSYRLNPLIPLDREDQKVYPLPFVTQDKKGRRGIRLFTLEVGDENDSPMSDGASTIKVYNYQGQFPSMVIGVVHVTDLDDFDLPDKMFEVEPTTPTEVVNHFQVDVNTGNITMLKGTPAGAYLLRVKVYDTFREESAVGEVSIDVVNLDHNAVLQSGSLTLADVRARQMLRRSKIAEVGTLYDRVKEEIAKIHEIDVANVDIFSMRDVEEGVQIRYNCHSSPYSTTAKLNGLLMTKRLEVSKSLGVDIIKVDSNDCLYESTSPCGSKSCQLTLRPNHTSPLVVSSSADTMVGVDIAVEYTCDCGQLEPLPSVCFSGFCHNGGTCMVSNNTLQCQCRDDKNYGPRCELINARFNKGYAWYEPLKVCDNSTFTLSFRTNDPNGMLLYMGPIVESPWEGYPKDFLYVFLRNWVLVIYFDLGSGTEKVSIPIEKDHTRIFKFSIDWGKSGMTFAVLDCGFHPAIGIADPCRISVPYPRVSRQTSYLLNIQGPLQLGGVAKMPRFASLSASYRWNLIPPSVEPFTGCFFEMRHNEFLYDLNATDYSSFPVEPCDTPRNSRVVFGQQSIFIILASLLSLLVLVLLILCLARRGRKTVAYPDVDKELVKETMGGTDVEAFGEKDVTHYDLTVLKVTPDGFEVEAKDEENNLPDVTQDALQCRTTTSLPRKPEGVTFEDFISSNVRKMDQQLQDIDDVRHYSMLGDAISEAASLSSLASGSSRSDISFIQRNEWSNRFEKIAQIYSRGTENGNGKYIDSLDQPKEQRLTVEAVGANNGSYSKAGSSVTQPSPLEQSSSTPSDEGSNAIETASSSGDDSVKMSTLKRVKVTKASATAPSTLPATTTSAVPSATITPSAKSITTPIESQQTSSPRDSRTTSTITRRITSKNRETWC